MIKRESRFKSYRVKLSCRLYYLTKTTANTSINVQILHDILYSTNQPSTRLLSLIFLCFASSPFLFSVFATIKSFSHLSLLFSFLPQHKYYVCYVKLSPNRGLCTGKNSVTNYYSKECATNEGIYF